MDIIDHEKPQPTGRSAGTAERTGPLTTLILVAGDVLVIQAIIALSVAARMLMAPALPIEMHASVYRGVQWGALALPLAYALGGLYPGYGMTSVQRLRLRVTLTSLFFGAMILFDYLAQKGQWSRGILVVAALMAIMLMPIWDALVIHLLIGQRRWGLPVVLFGPPAQRRMVREALVRQPELGWIPVAEADVPKPLPGALAIIANAAGLPDASLEGLPFSRVVLVPPLGDGQSLWISARDLGGMVGLEMRRNLLVPSSQWIKRGLDVVVVAALALPVALTIGVFALALRLLSPGPILYFQERGGYQARPFRMVKLRSMVPDAEARLRDLLARDPAARAEWEASMKLRHDPRVVPVVGRLMRRLSIDELPQLWNVWRGQMSLVGPRPLPAYHLDLLSPETRHLRAQVRPGVTGLWQVSGRSDLSLDEQQRLDVYYVRNWSLWLDIHILGRTLAAVAQGRGAH